MLLLGWMLWYGGAANRHWYGYLDCGNLDHIMLCVGAVSEVYCNASGMLCLGGLCCSGSRDLLDEQSPTSSAAGLDLPFSCGWLLGLDCPK